MLDNLSSFPTWAIILIVLLVLFDSVMKLLALWRSARNNHLVWFIFLALFNTIGILPIIYLVLYRVKSEKDEEA